MKRCEWSENSGQDIYLEYHDNEWSVPSKDDRYLFEMFVLESFHCGLSWLIVLKKRKAFIEAFDNFDAEKVSNYGEDKISELLANKDIIRHKGKILAAINNANRFKEVQAEFGSFSNYIWSFTDNKVIYKNNDDKITKNALSDEVSKDLKKRGFKFMGSVTTYSYLEAIGVMNNHNTYCYKYEGGKC